MGRFLLLRWRGIAEMRRNVVNLGIEIYAAERLLEILRSMKENAA